MKTLPIADVAWVATVTTIQDGDFATEANMDTVFDVVADRLGYLKARTDEKAGLAANNAMSGNNTHAGSETFNGAATFNNSSAFNDEITVNPGVLELFSGVFSFESGSVLSLPKETLADAADTIVETICRVPTLTANRTYTLPAASAGRIVIFSRPRSADAFTATLQDPTGPTTLGVVPISTAGWIVAYCDGSAWKPLLWSNGITSLLATV